MSSSLFAAFALLLVATVSGQSSLCTNLTPKANFDSSRFAGQWFGVHGLVQGIPSPGFKCLKENIQANADGQLTVTFQTTKIATNEQTTETVVGNPVNNVRSRLAFPSRTLPGSTNDVIILETDYDNYAILVTCMTKNDVQASIVLVMSRQPELSADKLESVKQTLRDNNIPDTLRALSQEGC